MLKILPILIDRLIYSLNSGQSAGAVLPCQSGKEERLQLIAWSYAVQWYIMQWSDILCSAQKKLPIMLNIIPITTVMQLCNSSYTIIIINFICHF